MADDQKLTIGINVTADTRGAQQAQQAVQAVTSGTKQATQATAEAGARAEGAARAWEGLRMSAQGGLQSIVGLGKAASGALQAVVGAVPFAKWIMWATALVAIIGQLTGTFREWFKTTKEGAEAAAKPVQSVKEQLEKLDRTTTALLRAQLDGIAKSATEAAVRIDALRTVADALNDAQEAVSLAQIRANDTLSPVEKLDAEQKVRETYRAARLEQAAQAIVDNSANSAREQLAYAESIATAAQATADAQKIYDQLAADDEAARKARLGQATNELRGASREAAESGIAPQLSERYQQAAAEYEAAREAATKESIDAWKKEVENAKKAVDSRKTAQDEVTAKANAAAESAKLAAIGLQAKFDALKAKTAGDRIVEGIERPQVVKKSSEQKDATAEDRKKAQAELDKLKADTEAAAQARMASGGAYEYTDEERAAIAEKQKALDKMGPATPAAPSAPAKPVKTTTYAPRTAAEKAGQQPGANEPASAGQPDLAGPLNEAAKKAGDSATQSADSIQAAAEAAKAVADNTKPLDASALTAALQAAATAQQTASTQTATGMQRLVALVDAQTSLAQQQSNNISKLTTQVEYLRQRVAQLSARAA